MFTKYHTLFLAFVFVHCIASIDAYTTNITFKSLIPITTRKKVNSGAQTVTVDIELPPLPCLPAVMPAVQTAAVCIFFFTFSFFNKTIETVFLPLSSSHSLRLSRCLFPSPSDSNYLPLSSVHVTAYFLFS
jgi:hypothetical protein